MIRSNEVTPFKTEIRAEWADYNGHFNVAYYTLVFDEAARDFVERRLKYAIGDSSLSVTVFDIDYLREVKVGRTVYVDTCVLAVNEEAIHILQTMREADEGYIAAVEERTVCLRDGKSGEARTLPDGLRATASKARDDARTAPLPDRRPKLTLESSGNGPSNTD